MMVIIVKWLQIEIVNTVLGREEYHYIPALNCFLHCDRTTTTTTINMVIVVVVMVQWFCHHLTIITIINLITIICSC